MSDENTTPPADQPNQPPAAAQNPKGDVPPPSDNAAGDKGNQPEGVKPEGQGGEPSKEPADKADPEKDFDKRFNERAQAAQAEAVKSWKDALAADPELGGDKAETTAVDIAAGIKAIGSEALDKFLRESNLIHFPELARAFAKAGRLTREGKFVSGSAPVEKPSIADRLYDKTPKA